MSEKKNYEKLAEFASRITNDIEINLRLITPDQKVVSKKASITKDTYEELFELSKKYRIYYHPNSGKRIDNGKESFYLCDSNITRINTFYLDFDRKELTKYKTTDEEYIKIKKELRDGLKNIIEYHDIKPTDIIETRHGFHFYYNVTDYPIDKIDRFSSFCNFIGEAFVGIEYDKKVVNPSCLLRLPFFPYPEEHSDFTTKLFPYNEERNYSTQDYLDWMGVDDINDVEWHPLPSPSIQYKIKEGDVGKYWVKFTGEELMPVTAYQKGAYLVAECPLCGPNGTDTNGDNLMLNLSNMIGGCWSCSTNGNSRGCKVFKSKEEYLESVKEFNEKKLPEDYDDLNWSKFADECNDTFFDSSNKITDLDHTERALELALKTKKDKIDQDIKKIIGNKYYKYIWDSMEQIGIPQKDIIPFVVVSVIGAIAGNSYHNLWANMSYKTALNTFTAIKAKPGSGKSPLYDIFLKDLTNTYEHDEAKKIAKKAIEQLEEDKEEQKQFVNNFKKQHKIKKYEPEEEVFEFSEEEISTVNAPKETPTQVDYEPFQLEKDDKINRLPFILKNTTKEARELAMAKCGYALQSGAEITEFIDFKNGTASEAVAISNRYYTGSSVNTNRVSRANQKRPNCHMSIITEGQPCNIEMLYTEHFVGSGFTPRFDIFSLGRRRPEQSKIELDNNIKDEFEEIILKIADKKIVISNKNSNLILPNVPVERYTNKKCKYKGEEYIILFAQYMGNYYNLHLSRMINPLNKDIKDYVYERHSKDIVPIIKFDDVVSPNMCAILNKITERLNKYIGIISLIRYEFGQKEYLEFDKTDVDFAINYLYYTLYHNMTNEYKSDNSEKDYHKIVSTIYKKIKDEETTFLEWRSLSNIKLIKKIGKTKVRDLINNEFYNNEWFKEEKEGKKIMIKIFNETKVKEYIAKGQV